MSDEPDDKDLPEKKNLDLANLGKQPKQVSRVSDYFKTINSSGFASSAIEQALKPTFETSVFQNAVLNSP
ncbi:hypothetical protein, partial [Roseibium sp.]|uniref:hypothetical protein n=1 Tax=Roseibium sp. TaxID=1936156 RepID=UPI003D1382F6